MDPLVKQILSQFLYPSSHQLNVLNRTTDFVKKNLNSNPLNFKPTIMAKAHLTRAVFLTSNTVALKCKQISKIQIT